MTHSMASSSFFADEEDAVASLSEDVGALWCRPVAVLDSPPDPFTFLRDFVHPNVPCVIKNAIPSDACGAASPPLTLNLDEIIHHVGEDAEVTVDVTPDGHGDCVRSVFEASRGDAKQQPRRRMFVKPHEKVMEIGKFRDMLRRKGRECDTSQGYEVHGNAPEIDCNGLELFPLHHCSNCTKNDVRHSSNAESLCGFRQSPIVYYSRQNDCLRTELAKLFATQLFPPTVPFAERAFGTGPPDAINLWIGNERSASSMHKDHYENMFYVCSGQKEFVLCPPANVVFLHEGEFPSGTFRPMDGGEVEGGELCDGPDGNSSWVVVADDNGSSDGLEEQPPYSSGGKTRWIEPDVKRYMEHLGKNGVYDKKFPMLRKAHPMKILVSEGELLYIPSLWFHRVTQTCETVGVNYWFDMKFDSPHWCYFNFLQNLRLASR